jgi:hypothetical protein
MTNLKKDKKIKKIMKKNPMCNPHPFSSSVINRLEELIGFDYEQIIYDMVVVKQSVSIFDLDNGDKCIITPFNFVGKHLLFVERVIGVGHTIVRKTEDGVVVGESELRDDSFYPFVYPNDKPSNISVNKEKRNRYVKSIGLPKDVEQSSLMKEMN